MDSFRKGNDISKENHIYWQIVQSIKCSKKQACQLLQVLFGVR